MTTLTPEMKAANHTTCLLAAAMRDCANCQFKPEPEPVTELFGRVLSRPYIKEPEALTERECWTLIHDAYCQKQPLPCVDFSDILGDDSESISARWEGVGESYKNSQPYHNDLYPYA